MKNKNDIDQLLAAAQRHYDDNRRQEKLSSLVDQWAAAEATTEVRKVPLAPRSRRHVWYAVAASVALLVASGVALSIWNDGSRQGQVAVNASPQTIAAPHAGTTHQPETPTQRVTGTQYPIPANRTVRQPHQQGTVMDKALASQTATADAKPAVEYAENTTIAMPDETIASVDTVALPDTDVPRDIVAVAAAPQQKPITVASNVKTRTSTRLVANRTGVQQPSSTRPPKDEAPRTFLAFMPMGSTEMHIDLYTFELR